MFTEKAVRESCSWDPGSPGWAGPINDGAGALQMSRACHEAIGKAYSKKLEGLVREVYQSIFVGVSIECHCRNQPSLYLSYIKEQSQGSVNTAPLALCQVGGKPKSGNQIRELRPARVGSWFLMLERIFPI